MEILAVIGAIVLFILCILVILWQAGVLEVDLNIDDD